MIGILSYGLGNIKAFANVYKRLNIPHVIAERPEDIAAADRLILPGVGAFDHAMIRLKASGLAEALDDAVRNQRKPVLGICVGMQMMANGSDEGTEQGLGWIDGTVRKIAFPPGQAGLLPHMGWNTVTAVESHPLLANIDQAFGFYFLHSYRFECSAPDNAIAQADYAGKFTCAVQAGNVYGVQFHPEKSHHNGVQLLKNFSEI